VDNVIGARHHSLGKDNQRPASVLNDIDRRIDRLPVHPFAIDAKGAAHPRHPGREAALHKEVPTADGMQRGADVRRQAPQHHGIAQPAMIGGQHDAIARGHSLPQRFHISALDRCDAPKAIEVPGQKWLQHRRPPTVV
jgi:hypothetical protein